MAGVAGFGWGLGWGGGFGWGLGWGGLGGGWGGSGDRDNYLRSSPRCRCRSLSLLRALNNRAAVNCLAPRRHHARHKLPTNI